MSADPLEVGSPAPDFELRDQHGQGLRLSGLRGSPVVLVFYPWAFSRVCTGELENLRDTWAVSRHADITLLAISCDPMHSLRAYAEAARLGFPLLSDFWPHGAISAGYGVFDPQRGCARRSTYILDSQGVARWAVHNPSSEARKVADYLAALDEVTETDPDKFSTRATRQ